jgi:GPH family glycoside/pentoside/hexuronide:cation symporter
MASIGANRMTDSTTTADVRPEPLAAQEQPASVHDVEVAPEDRVPLGQKVAYGLGTTNDMWGNWLYPGMVWPVFNMFLLVSPGLVSTAVMVNRLIDAVADPVFGWLSDNTRSRWGRRRPYILIGSILSGLLLPTLFLVGRGWSERAYFWYMVVSSSIYITVVSSFNMAYQSLGMELTPDYRERTSVYAFKSGVQKLPEIAMFFASAFITLEIFNDSTGKPNILRGAQVYSVLLGAIMILVGVVVFTFVKERYYGHIVSQKQAKTSLGDSVWKAMRCRPFRAQLAMALAYGIGTSMVGSLGYYATVYYVCKGDVALGSKWNFGMGIANMVFGLFGIPVYATLARYVGKPRAMTAVQVSAILVFIATWWLYTPSLVWLQLFASGLISFTGAGFWTLYGSISADVVDYDELESGKRREGAFQSCQAWILKVGMALGMGAAGFLLTATGFDAALGGHQPERALTLIRVYLAGIPVVGLLLALYANGRFGLTEAKMREIRQLLEARRGKI